MAEEQIKKRIDLPNEWSEDDLRQAFVLINNIIVERTRNNISSTGKRFPNYSKSYSQSLEFELAGKSRTDPNLTLTGNMLESIQLLEVGTGYIIIGYEAGTEENDKAVWAERENGEENKRGPARKFLGLQDFELEQVIAEINLTRADSAGQDGNDINSNLNDVNTIVQDQFINSIINNTKLGD